MKDVIAVSGTYSELRELFSQTLDRLKDTEVNFTYKYVNTEINIVGGKNIIFSLQAKSFDKHNKFLYEPTVAELMKEVLSE